ncbi:DUF663-domain-containing protein [Jaminaea rosea]|uniref:DUF663-domain-containing protein n=1 Tax=Jaminaea rosea TaxID=1569628 RepID=A0A316UK81_9BASI|nr:DUF663-domain-containing protein [Jaminaea rosea]PWN25208.1 DUF663-domain-containing protein [Jaminaea rosea]
MAGHHHRSTLKQRNKPFKSKHSTKSSIKKLAKGRPASVASHSSSTTSGAIRNAQSRKNQAKQIQLAKREAIKQAQRLYEGGMPKVVSVLELTPDANAWQVCASLERSPSWEAVRDVRSALQSGLSSCQMRSHSTNLQFLPLPYGSLYPTLSAVASSDFVILVLSATHSIEEGSWGELALRILHAQGMPEVLAVVPTVKDAAEGSSAGKTGENAVRKSLTSFVKYFDPSTDRIYALDVDAERDGLLRTMATSVPRFPAWREARPYLIADGAEWRSEGEERGTLVVKGWSRGNAIFSAQRLVHVRDFGDFRVKRIVAPAMTKGKGKRARRDVEMEDAEQLTPDGLVILDERDDEEADDLQSENTVSEGLNGMQEQTWPTEEEMAQGEARQRQAEKEEDKYKTRWLIEESDGEEGGDDSDEEENAGMLGGSDAFESVPVTGWSRNGELNGDDEDDEPFDDEDVDDAALYAQQGERRARAEEDLEFPDEVDTPLHIPARQRFARYRGMASMRSSTWDAYEELPAEYSRIFQFDDWERVKRAVEGKARIDGVSMGREIAIEIEDVPVEMARRFGAIKDADMKQRLLPMTVWGLLRHEHKKTVANFTVLRNTEYTETVKSKDPVLMLLGPRLLCVNPIYSEHSLGTSTSRPIPSAADGSVQVHPHKFHRFLPPPSPTPSVATIYAPITFGSPSITLLRPRSWGATPERGYDERGVGANQYPDLIGSGSLLKKNGNGPLRVNVKRVLLTGEPFKIHKKTATIRWMFFQPEDVRYFAPIPLRTKYGRTGHIREPLGTHGRFKAHFDGPIGQMDTIMMALYKRVYPKFTTEEYTDGWDELPAKFLEAREAVEAKSGKEDDGDRGMDM